MLMGTALYLLFAFIPAFDGISPALGDFFDAILPLFMFLVLFVTFCKVDFRKLIPVWWNFWICLFQAVFVWILVGAIILFHLKGDDLTFVESILTCVISPCAAAGDGKARRTAGGDYHLWFSFQLSLRLAHPNLLSSR